MQPGRFLLAEVRQIQFYMFDIFSVRFLTGWVDSVARLQKNHKQDDQSHYSEQSMVAQMSMWHVQSFD